MISMLGNDKPVQTCINKVPVTFERRPYNPTPPENEILPNPGTARVNLAPSLEAPQGSENDGWATKHQDRTVLQQHCSYFDADGDGVIWPLDTFRGFRDLGFGILLSLISMFIIHLNFSYPTSPSVVPDPLFRIYLENIHKAKHGSDSGTYDNEGRFIPQKFEDIFSKYAGNKDGLNKRDIWDALKGQRVLFDVFGTLGTLFEWIALYLMIAPEDGVVRKEDVRRVYDGSLFPEMALRRSGKAKAV